ncbi:MAG: hypothetical protein ACR5K9_08685 [Wolbachia sp.]
MGYVINLLNFPIIAKKSSFSFVPLPMKLGISKDIRENDLSWTKGEKLYHERKVSSKLEETKVDQMAMEKLSLE